MWDRIIGPRVYYDIVKTVDSSLDTDKIKQCICAWSQSTKRLKCFRYTDASFTLLLYVYKCKTENYWVFNYAVTGTYDIANVAGIIIQRIRLFMKNTDSQEFRIRVTSKADAQILGWIRNKTNVTDYKPEEDNTRLKEYIFRGSK